MRSMRMASPLSPLRCRLGKAGLSPAFTDLVTLLFMKMCRSPLADWQQLTVTPVNRLVTVYRQLCRKLAQQHDDIALAEIFAHSGGWDDAASLAAVILQINTLDWADIRAGGIGAAFEQFVAEQPAEHPLPTWHAPVPLNDMVTGLLQPEPGEIVLDYCAGNAGFAVAAHAYRQTLWFEDPLHYLKQSADSALIALENAPLQLARMNVYLHEAGVRVLPEATDTPPADVLFANLPARLLPEESEEAIVARETALMARCLATLKPRGRGALIVTDVLLYHPAAVEARRMLLDEYCLHTVLRLPDGIFQGRDTQAHLLFFQRGTATETRWFFDLRSGLPWFDPEHTPLTHRSFNPFIHAYGEQPDGSGKRRDSGENGRFRCFTRAQLAAENDNLDLCWLPEDMVADPIYRPRRQSTPYSQVFHEMVTELQGLCGVLRIK